MNRRGKVMQHMEEAIEMKNWLERDKIDGGNIQLLEQC